MANPLPQSTTIGIVTTWLDSDYWRQTIAGAAHFLLGKKLVPVCFALTPEARGQEGPRHPFYELVSSSCLSGMMVLNAAFRAEAEPFFRDRRSLPAVCVGQWIPGVPSLWIQNAAGIRLLMKHLTEACGRRRIAFIRGIDGNAEAEARFRAWEDFCIERSLEHGPNLVAQGDFSEESGEAAALELLDAGSGSAPDAIVASNDLMAIGALRAVKQRRLNVPREVSVVGFDDLQAERADPPLTTVRQPVYEMGSRAAEVLLAKISGEKVQTEHMFAPELVVRASCRPAPDGTTKSTHAPVFGASVFLERAYPSVESTFAAVWEDLVRPNPGQPPRKDRLQLLGRLGGSLDLANAHERALLDGGMRVQSYALRQLAAALADVTSFGEMKAPLRDLLPLLGIQRLTVAKVRPEGGFAGEAQLVLSFHHDGADPVDVAGSSLPASEILAASARSPGHGLRMVKPLFDGARASGFFIVSGTLLENSVLDELGCALSTAVQRLG